MIAAMWSGIAAGAALGAAGVTAWGVRGKSSSLLAPSVWRGPADVKALALTFDDGPSEATPALLDLLEEYGVRATFFACGMHVRRLPEVARRIAGRHEIGNHTESHARLYLRSPAAILEELSRAQRTILEITGVSPQLFRATYGARWFGLRAAQRQLGLTGVMWSTIGCDWRLPAEGVARRLNAGLRPGAIICLHDGREQRPNPDISATLGALRLVLPQWQDKGYRFVTVSELLTVKRFSDGRARA
jgi:peptidoglycan/xylan/chitin deacetylase (PgdA/CDA1 family)